MNADGSGRRTVGVPFYTNYERWAPNGKIVFVRAEPESESLGKLTGGDLYEVNPDGSGLRRLTKGASLIQPYVSPDGSTIAAYATKTDRLIALPYRGDGPAVTLLAHASQYFPNGGMAGRALGPGRQAARARGQQPSRGGRRRRTPPRQRRWFRAHERPGRDAGDLPGLAAEVEIFWA